MKASDLLVKCLENEGIKYVFGIPGEENLDFLDSLRDSNIRLVVTRHEQAAGFMAATVGRLTGVPGAALSTLGPGATNFTTAAAYAQLGGMPMLMISGQKPIRSNKQGEFQIVDIVGMMKPLTKFTHQVRYENNIPRLVREAVAEARAERPGAAHLELPEDIAAADTGVDVMPVTEKAAVLASEKAVDEAAAKIKSAKNPLLLVGGGANRPALVKAFNELMDSTGLYSFCTQMGKGVVDERHPQFLQAASLSAHDHVHCAVAKADLIISVGHDVREKPPFLMQTNDAEVIHISPQPSRSPELYEPCIEVIGEMANTLERLATKLEGEKWDFDYYSRLKADITDKLSADFEDERFPMIPQRVVSEMRKIMTDDGIVALDNGMYKLWFARHYETRMPNTLLLDNALATMGAGLPSAMAAKLVHPDKKVVAICGDGGFMMNSQELETAVREKIDVVVLVLNDSGYGMIKWKQDNMNFDSYGLDFGNPDFVKYAESYGAKGERVESIDQLAEKLEAAFQAGGVHVIDVPIDYSVNTDLSSATLKAEACIA